ncbi:efflux RND transporter permease subunit [Brevundimonas sp.]|uniref:efflux RND transporter permease subunit n=1 Tax=Brevundimonas sp. TaxID=1871086 RepID=UPI0025B8F25D|nr:efflux RND transporter permease subunit [Brevundimonas sp.]
MNLSEPFIRRPIATVLLSVGIALAGIAAFFVLPVAPLPQVDYPAISVQARLPGASPDTMASSVATPLERRLGVISDVNEMTSQSSTGSTRINLQFNLNRNIDGAAREVQAAINAARADLPTTLRSNPTYTKSNPSSAPVIIMALTSDTKTPGQIYDAVSNIVSQRVAQVEGVGEVEIGGGSLPAVRVQVNPFALNTYGISLEDVRAAIQAANADRPKGTVEGEGRRFQIYTDAAGKTAADYARLIVAWRNNAGVRLADVASVTDGVADTRTLGLFNGKPAIIVLISSQPGANIIDTVDGVRAVVPELQAQLPSDIKIQVASDRTNSIRASLHEIELTLVVSLILVVLVVSAFLRSARATFIPTVATIVSLLGTFGVMYLLGFSLNNLSLMAITVATGFVVDDAIVVLENTQRHIEAGMERFKAALLGAREVGFTVLSISISLVAVFIPLLFMGGQTGRLFREFAVTLSAAVMISLVISLTLTPMMCAYLLKPRPHGHREGRIGRTFEAAFARIQNAYSWCLDWALQSKPIVVLSLAAVIGLTAYLYVVVPKGFFPQQDNGQLMAGVRADQSVSFQAMSAKLKRVVDIIHADPAVDTVVGFTGGARAGGAFMFVNLKPLDQRNGDKSADVIGRLRPKLGQVEGLSVFLNPVQDLRMGGRQSNSTYQYTLISDSSADLRTWGQKLEDELKTRPELTDVDSDLAQNGVETYLTIDHDTAARMGVTPRAIDNSLYDSFGQRQVATIYQDINQYSVILEWLPQFAKGPEALADVQVPTSPAGGSGAAGLINPALRDPSTGSALVTITTPLTPLAVVASAAERPAATSVNHQNGELATTVSFNLAEGVSLSQGQAIVNEAVASLGMPINVRGSFAGQAAQAQQQNQEQPMLILAALVAIYLVLGILYESTVHPITVLSTLPAAGVGAVLALMLFGMEFSIIALIGVFLLLGIVKKNAILIIDFALDAQRSRGLSAVEAVREASLLRFRPILMTTLAAGLGVLPLAIGFGEGAELRRPLGITIIGGLIASQLLTLITTPVVYVYLDKLRKKRGDERALARGIDTESSPA